MTFWSIVGAVFLLLLAAGWWADRRGKHSVNRRTPDAETAAGWGTAQSVATRIHQNDVGGGLGPM